MTNTTMTATEFLASLPAPLNLRGVDRVTVADVRKTLRGEIKLAIAAGVIPAGAEFSVRGDYNHITVEVTAWRTMPLTNDYINAVMDDACGRPAQLDEIRNDRNWYGRGRRTDVVGAIGELNETLALLETMVQRHNFDESRIEVDYFNVGYYHDVTASGLLARAERGIREELSPALAAKRAAAREAAVRLGKACTKAVCGRMGVDGCGEWVLDSLLKIDARAAGRPVAYDKRARGWRAGG
jgi:hypothetical protein